MNNSMIKLLAPQLIKMASKPELKEKLIELIKAKKRETLDRYLDEEGFTEDDLPLSDIVLQLSQSADEIFVKVLLVGKYSGTPDECLAVYRWEELIEGLQKLV